MTQTRKQRRQHAPEAGWKLHDAKALFSELVRRARTEGPQRVTVRGQDAVVVIAADELERLLPPTTQALPFVAFMETLQIDGRLRRAGGVVRHTREGNRYHLGR